MEVEPPDSQIFRDTIGDRRMIDVQKQQDQRGIPIEYVGVTGVRYPIVVLDRTKDQQQTIADIAISVELPHEFRGTHMSRFIEVLEHHRGVVTMHTIPAILAEVKARLEAERARIEISFPYFIERAAPVSGAKAFMDYQCSFTAEMDRSANDFILGIRVPVSTLCPCSKSISDYGAHNQRGYVDIKVRSIVGQDGMPELMWLEELVEIAESSASSPVLPLVKRVDERYLTMQAYDKPAFVEDIVRDVAAKLRNDVRVAWFSVRCENHESIHNHNVFAQVSGAAHQSSVPKGSVQSSIADFQSGRDIRPSIFPVI
jgi:GTP cyclohydrolase IB